MENVHDAYETVVLNSFCHYFIYTVTVKCLSQSEARAKSLLSDCPKNTNVTEDVKCLLSAKFRKIRKIPLQCNNRSWWLSPYAITDLFEDLDIAIMDTRMRCSCPFWIVLIDYFSHNSLFSLNYLILTLFSCSMRNVITPLYKVTACQ